MTNYTPTRKVGWGVALGSLVTICAWVSRDFLGIEIPGEIQGALQTFLVFTVQWWVPDSIPKANVQ